MREPGNHRSWKLRPMTSVSVRSRTVFATRSCCGPGGVGRCQSFAEGLPCGTTRLLERVPLDPAAEGRAEELRRLRISLGIGLRAASAGLVLTPVELSQLERAKLDVDDWSALFASLRTLGERR